MGQEKKKERGLKVLTFKLLRSLSLEEIDKIKEKLGKSLAQKRKSVVLVLYYPRKPLPIPIQDQDAAEVMDALREIGKVKKIDLVVCSRGGNLHTAYQITTICREHCEKFGVIIPRDAYSAATLIALGADELIMGPLGALGPLDPMIKYPGLGWIPGMAIRRAPEVLNGELKASRSKPEHKGKFIIQPMAIRLDTVIFSMVSDLVKAAVPYGLDLLSKVGKREDEAKSLMKTLVRGFPHHGLGINREMAKKMGFNVIDVDSEIHDLAFDLIKCYQIECEKIIELEHAPRLCIDYFKVPVKEEKN